MLRAEVPRAISSIGSSCRSGRTRSPRSSAHSRCAPSVPLRASGWRIVLRLRKAADSMSSKPTTDSWPGTATPSRSAAASTPMAWVSEAAKIADGGSGDFSSCAACSAATAASCGPPPDQAGLDVDTRRGQGLLVPAQPVRGGGEAEPGRGHVADEGDPPVPQADEVAGRQPPAGHVVDDRLRHPGVGRVHADQGDPGPGELAELATGQRQADGQYSVGPVRRQQRLQVPVPLGRAVHVAHDRVVALLLQHGQRAGHPHDRRRPGHVGDDERHGVRRAADQGRRGVARPVAQPLDRVEHRPHAWTRVPGRFR